MTEIRVAGVLGGMGPEATVDFMRNVLLCTPAECDQQHIPMLINHNPRVPDRQLDTPAQRSAVERALTEMALTLQSAGADFLVMPCNTATDFIGPAQSATSIPFLNIVSETTDHIIEQGISKAGLMAVGICANRQLYPAAAAASSLTFACPDDEAQATLMPIVRQIKGGDSGETVRKRMREIALGLVAQGAEVIVAGCTEIPLVLDDDLPVPLVSSTDVLAQRTVALSLGTSSAAV